jgi:hypothetical protein
MRRRLFISGLAALCATAFSVVAASGASATATAYTATSSTAIPAGTSTGLAVDQLSNWVLATEQFGAKLVLTETGGIDCENCMVENQASPMDFTGTGGRLLFTGVTVNVPNCTVEEPGKGAGTVTTEPLKVTASVPTSAMLSPVTPTTFAVIHVVGGSCVIKGNYTVKGSSVTATVSGDVLKVNSTTELKTNGELTTLTGEATLTAGVTGGTYNPIELKAF